MTTINKKPVKSEVDKVTDQMKASGLAPDWVQTHHMWWYALIWALAGFAMLVWPMEERSTFLTGLGWYMLGSGALYIVGCALEKVVSGNQGTDEDLKSR